MISNIRETQMQMEQDMFDYGAKRIIDDSVKAQKRQAWGESRIGKAFVKGAARDFVEAVQAFLSQPNTHARRSNRAAELLNQTGLSAEQISFLFVKAIFNFLPKLDALGRKARFYNGAKRVSICIRGASLIHDQWRIKEFEDGDKRKKLLQVILADMNKRGYPREWKVRTLRNQFHAHQVNWDGWNDGQKLQVGYALLTLFMAKFPGLLQHPLDMNGKPKKHYLEPTDAFYEKVSDAFGYRSADMMLYQPMIVKPLPWTKDHLFRGGYLTNKVKPYGLILGTKPRDVSRLISADIQPCLDAVNAMQETPYRINQRIYEVFEWVVKDRRGGIAGVCELEKLDRPPMPANYHTDEAVKKAHNYQLFLLHDRDRQNKSKAILMMMTLMSANKYRKYEEIYFPHFLDHRGRAYPKTIGLTPQGADYAKAMLEFSRGHVIEDLTHWNWLAIAAANAYGMDKVSLKERIDWVTQNRSMFSEIATDPFADLRWSHASEPFQFLRACFELHDFAQALKANKPFVSHMVVPVDATCSGLQHYAAMLADEVGGRSVNLVPGLPRQDVYGDVASRTITLLQGLDDEMSRNLIMFGIDRSTVKRQVMVVPYAATMASCMDYTRDALMARMDEGHKPTWDTTDGAVHNAYVTHLSKTIWQAIEDVVLKGREAMQWISKAGREYAKYANANKIEEPAIEWVLPDGFPVRHVVFDDQKKRVETFIDGRVSLVYYEPTTKVKGSSMGTSLPPNFIHSYDACHLRMSVCKGLAQGINDYCMVHDSFGVHAAKMEVFLSQCVKPAFIEMYDNTDRLAELRDQLPADLDLPPLPTRGSLDLKGVASSEYFFS